MKKLLLIPPFLLVFTALCTHSYTWLPIEVKEPVKPFEIVFEAVCQIESNGNPLAYNSDEGAVGIVQIRKIKLDDYNRLTGSNIKHDDCFSVEISKEIFLWHMAQYGVYRIDEAIRRWNGDGEMSYQYLQKVKNQLKIN